MSRRRQRAAALLALIVAGSIGSVWTFVRYRANARARQLSDLVARAEAAEARALAAESRAAAAEAKALALENESSAQRLVERLDVDDATVRALYAKYMAARSKDGGSSEAPQRGAEAPGMPVVGVATEDDKRRAVKHWNEGIKHFQKGQMSKARDEWLLCSRLDAGNADCASGLQRLDRNYGGGL